VEVGVGLAELVGVEVGADVDVEDGAVVGVHVAVGAVVGLDVEVGAGVNVLVGVEVETGVTGAGVGVKVAVDGVVTAVGGVVDVVACVAVALGQGVGGSVGRNRAWPA
jgi:hypothetical protein